MRLRLPAKAASLARAALPAAAMLVPCAWAGSSRAEVPLPPVRPRELSRPASPAPPPAAPQPPASPAPAAPPADLAAEHAVCDRVLGTGQLIAETLPTIADPNGCGIAVPLRVFGVRLANGATVQLAPPAVVRCDFAQGLAGWLRDDLTPLLFSSGRKLTRLWNAGSYECRGRNRVAGAKLSEHAHGNALDLRALSFADGHVADITRVKDNAPLFAQLKLTACARFSTVLGPNSDGFHEDNLHLDFEARKNGDRLCQWNLP